MVRYTLSEHPYLSAAEIEGIHARARHARAVAIAAFVRQLRHAVAKRLRAWRRHGIKVAVPKAGGISLTCR